MRVFERKQHVQLLSQPVPIASLKLGDAVVAFSRRDVLMLRDQIAASGHPVSVIYGALPPEVRRREAERFASGESHILVATDAIGMGLNLPIRRVLFSTLTKFDGVAPGEQPARRRTKRVDLAASLKSSSKAICLTDRPQSAAVAAA